MIFIKNNIWQILVVGLLIFIIFSKNLSGCNSPADAPKIVTKSDTTITQVPQPIVIVPPYTPQATSSQAPIIIPPAYQPSRDYEALLKQYNELANKFLSTNNYKDSISLKDSTGQRVGVVNLDDDVQKNEIIKRSPNYQLSFPKTEIHTTTTITLPPEKRTQVYIGGEIVGNQTSVFNATNLGFLLKTKSDQIYGLKGGVQFINNQVIPQVGLSAYWKIKLRK